MDAFWMAVDALQTLEDIKAEIDQINEYDYPKDDRTISKFKNIVLEIIDKHTK